jgi:S-adenosylmethionine hydrolase
MFLVKNFFLLFLIIGAFLNNTTDSMYEIDKHELKIINEFSAEIEMNYQEKNKMLDSIKVEDRKGNIILKIDDNEVELFELLDSQYTYAIGNNSGNKEAGILFLESLYKILENNGFTTLEKFYFDKISKPLNENLNEDYGR